MSNLIRLALSTIDEFLDHLGAKSSPHDYHITLPAGIQEHQVRIPRIYVAKPTLPNK